METKVELKKEIVKKILIIALCIMVALISIFVIAKRATNPESYKSTIESIDEKKATVMAVTAAAAAASTALASVPGDATTPISTEIMDVSSCLLIVVCALVLEKSLLTIMGYLSFNILIPIACVLLAVSVFAKRELFQRLSLKFAVFGLVISFIIPFSLKISDMIYEANQSTVTELTSESESMEEEDQSIWDKIKDSAVAVKEKAKELMNKFIDTIALFIIAYCAIPVVVFLVVIWFVKMLFNITIPLPTKDNIKSMNPLRRKKSREEE